MVEHVLAALAGLQIDNCQIWVDRGEMPGLDGSSQEIVHALLAVGIQQLPSQCRNLEITKSIRVGDEYSWISAEPSNGKASTLRYELNYAGEPAIGRQTCVFSMGDRDFANAIAPARTFVTQQEAELLRREGLALRVSYGDLLVFNHLGVIQNTLRFENECARHKLLDLIGDLSLAGCELIGNISAFRSGHRLNAELVRQLLATHAQFNPLKRSA
jgi:UDP-3-O-acyl N-acetylglucosamine deacetylase